MTDLFIKLFRLEKPLYHWRERPSPSAFMMNFERKYKPKMFRIRIVKSIRFWSVFAAIVIAIYVLLGSLSRGAIPVNLNGLFFGILMVFIMFGTGLTLASLATAFTDREIALFDRVMRVGGDNVSWKYQEFEYFAFTQIIYPSNGTSFPCLVLFNGNQGRVIVGIPKPEIALRVTEILSSRMTLRTDYEPITLEDEKT